MDIFLHCLYAFLVGGFICLIGQVLIDYTKLTPARILVSYVVAGVILTAIGVYEPIVEFAGAGATVPLTGRYKNRFLVTTSRRACISLPSGAKNGKYAWNWRFISPVCPRAL